MRHPPPFVVSAPQSRVDHGPRQHARIDKRKTVLRNVGPRQPHVRRGCAPPQNMVVRRLEIKPEPRDSKSTMMEPNSKYCVKHAYFILENSTFFEFRSNLFWDLNVLVLRYAKCILRYAERKMLSFAYAVLSVGVSTCRGS